MTRWPGFTVASLKRHGELVPLFGAVGFGIVLCTAYLGRLSFGNPDVSWNKKTNPEPWNHWKQSDKFKFGSTREYKGREFPKERPNMSDERYSHI